MSTPHSEAPACIKPHLHSLRSLLLLQAAIEKALQLCREVQPTLVGLEQMLGPLAAKRG